MFAKIFQRLKRCPSDACQMGNPFAGLPADEIQTLFWDHVCAGDVQAVRQLVACGADINAFDTDGYSALHMASLHGCDEMHRLLMHMREREAKRLETRHAQAA